MVNDVAELLLLAMTIVFSGDLPMQRVWDAVRIRKIEHKPKRKHGRMWTTIISGGCSTQQHGESSSKFWGLCMG